jgi:NAD(P)H-nitrite reductase large subunit
VEIWTRVTPGVEYVKVVVHRGKVVGALLIGDTDLEEVFENLILNKLDVSRLGVEMLDPAIDIQDYFD